MLCFILSNSSGTEQFMSHKARRTFSSKLGSTTLGASWVVVIVVIVSLRSMVDAGPFSRHLDIEGRPAESSLDRPGLETGFPDEVTGEVGPVVGGV